jgi:hypothetical protein
MKIKSIEITNVKGISNETFQLDLNPNKPSILVAPNGFGKSSFGIGFNSLGRDKINLDEKHNHNNDSSNLPEIKINIQDSACQSILIANSTSNSISEVFDVFVINSQLMSKATKMRIGSNVIVKSSLEISPTVLVPTIPKKIEFGYHFADAKRSFGSNGKILQDISSMIYCAPAIWQVVTEVPLHKFNQVKVLKSINGAKDEINDLEGTADQIRNWLNTHKIGDYSSISELEQLASIINSYDFPFLELSIDSYLAALQFIELFKQLGNDFKKAVNYLFYLDEKSFYEKILADFNTTRYQIKPKEDKKSGLIVEWPKAHEISNGQRDVLSFITLLMKAKRGFKKQNCILIIDEIFDYLDDANLISFQYFITDMIEEMKKSGKNFFPILMTHLDPMYFNHFCFNRHKLKVCYLKPVPQTANPNLLKLIRNREDSSIEASTDVHYFHFHPDSVNLSTEFTALGLPSTWGDSTRFHQMITGETQKFLNDQDDYDPLAICFGVRVRIEELLHNKILDPNHRQEFIDKHGTKKKMEYCEEIGIEVPEIYYLLGIIYNDRLHWRNGIDIVKPIALKLENITIKKMIKEIFQ